MMHRIRIARTPRLLYTALLRNGEPVIDSSSLILKRLRGDLPSAWGMVLAEPRQTVDTIDWWGEGLGNPTPLHALPPHERGTLLAVLKERLDHIRSLTERARASDPELAELIRLATQFPDDSCVYSVAGQPCVIFWGHATAGAALLVSATAGAVPGAAVAPTGTASAAAKAGSASGPSPVERAPDANPIPAAAGAAAGGTLAGGALGWRAGVIAGLTFLLFVLLFAGLAFWLRWWPVSLFTGDDLQARLRQEDERAATLKAEVDALEARLQDARKSCRALEPGAAALPLPLPTEPPAKPPATLKPEPIPAPPPAAAVEPPPAPVEAPLPKTKPAPPPPAPAVTPPAVAPEAPPTPPAQSKPKPQQAATCPPPRQPWEAPEVVFALDASGSMSFPFGMSDADEAALVAGVQRGDPAALAQARAINANRAGERRIDHAKRAMKAAVDKLPGDVDAGLVVFGNCKGTDNFNFFKKGERPRLQGIVDGIQPQQGTPLARGIERAANMMDGSDPKRPAVIVVLSDGHDSCGTDPCATARRLKAQKPGLVINVVQVTTGDSASCLARETGGRVFNAQDVGGVMPAVQKATGQTPIPAECRGQ